jgi:hypothetical protein
MAENNYSDGVRSIQILDGVVRMELIELQAAEDGAAPKPQTIGTLSMALPGFLRTYDQMTQVINQLIEKGVLKKNDTAPAANSKIAQ